MDSAFKLFFVKPTKLELDMFVVTLTNQLMDKANHYDWTKQIKLLGGFLRSGINVQNQNV